jgi:hypothetical protein
MRSLLIPLVALVVVAVLTVLAVMLAKGRLGRRDWTARCEEVLTSHGAARCVIAARLLRDLTARSGRELADAWTRIEMPLLQALPDCPPDWKVELINALDAAAKAAPRDTARAIMTMRNSLIA